MKGNFDIIILSRDNHKNKFLVLNHDIEHLNFTFFLPHSLHFFLSFPCPSFSLTFLFSFFPSSASLLLPSPFVLFKFLCVCVCVCVCMCVHARAQSYSTLCDPMNYNTPGFSVQGIFQARTLEWVAISFSRRSSLGALQIIVSFS